MKEGQIMAVYPAGKLTYLEFSTTDGKNFYKDGKKYTVIQVKKYYEKFFKKRQAMAQKIAAQKPSKEEQELNEAALKRLANVD